MLRRYLQLISSRQWFLFSLITWIGSILIILFVGVIHILARTYLPSDVWWTAWVNEDVPFPFVLVGLIPVSFYAFFAAVYWVRTYRYKGYLTLCSDTAIIRDSEGYTLVHFRVQPCDVKELREIDGQWIKCGGRHGTLFEFELLPSEEVVEEIK